MRFLLLIVLIFSSVAAFAVRSVDDQRVDHIVLIAGLERVEGKVILEVRRFAAELFQRETAVGHIFSDEEIKNLARSEIRAHGHKRCFTGAMRVLTPSGYVPIKNLKKGDKVISWDVAEQRVIVNYIQTVHITENSEYGRLCDVAPEGQIIEATESHPFFSSESMTYEELRFLPEDSHLLHFRDCETSLVRRGVFEFPVGNGRVFTFTLELSPNNFILEGILVHNKPGHIT
jgi:hypothetical protein